LFLAISPWHIHFSRGGWEVNVATFLITTGVWLLIKAQNDKKFIYLSAISFVASIYTYHAARIVVPLLLLGSAFYWRKTLWKGKSTWMAIALGTLLLLPLGHDLLGPAGISRAAGVGLFADLGPHNKTNEQRGEHTSPSGPIAQVLHNKVINYGIAFTQNYGKHFSGDFLFLSGDDIQRDKVPEFGQMYLFDIIFLIVGLGGNFCKKQKMGFGRLVVNGCSCCGGANLSISSRPKISKHGHTLNSNKRVWLVVNSQMVQRQYSKKVLAKSLLSTNSNVSPVGFLPLSSPVLFSYGQNF
jgi:hypothetical protein